MKRLTTSLRNRAEVSVPSLARLLREAAQYIDDLEEDILGGIGVEIDSRGLYVTGGTCRVHHAPVIVSLIKRHPSLSNPETKGCKNCIDGHPTGEPTDCNCDCGHQDAWISLGGVRYEQEALERDNPYLRNVT